MPPSPRIKATLNTQAYEDVCKLLNIRMPVIQFVSGHKKEGQVAWGDFSPVLWRIRVYLGLDQYEHDKLRFCQSECVRTILHELRHAWQFQHDQDMWKAKILIEADAENWAQDQVASWRGLVRITRTFPGSGMSRLEKTSRRVA